MNLPDNPTESFRQRNPHLYKKQVWPNLGEAPIKYHPLAADIVKLHTADKLRIVICGQIRGGKNNICITRTGHRFPNKKWAAWRDEAVRGVVEQMPHNYKTITEPVNVRVTYVAGDRRRRDQPAILDAIFHVLENACVVEDDVQIWVTESSRSYDKDSPRAIVEIISP